MSLQVGSGSASRGSIQIGSGGGGQPLTAVLAASTGGTFTGWLSSLLVMPAGNPNPGIGTLDLGGMTSCAVDAQRIQVATGGSGASLRGTLKLPPGTVTAGMVEVGATTGAVGAFGRLELSNTVVTVTGALTNRNTGTITVRVDAEPSGLSLEAPAADALAAEASSKLNLVFAATTSSRPHYALRWAGDHKAALDAMVGDGRLVIDDAALGKDASVFVSGGVTYVGLPPAGGTVLTVR